MTDTSAIPADPFAEAMAWQLAAVRELGDLCLELARLTAAKAKAMLTAEETPEPDKTPDPVRRFERLTRAVRLTVGLHDRLLHRRQARTDRLEAEQAARDAEAAEKLDDRRLTGGLRRAMTQFIVKTAIEAEEREVETVERMFDGLQARLLDIGEDPADFDEIHVKNTAYAIAIDLGADPGPDWWFDGWKIKVPGSRARPDLDRSVHAPP